MADRWLLGQIGEALDEGEDQLVRARSSQDPDARAKALERATERSLVAEVQFKQAKAQADADQDVRRLGERIATLKQGITVEASRTPPAASGFARAEVAQRGPVVTAPPKHCESERPVAARCERDLARSLVEKSSAEVDDKSAKVMLVEAAEHVRHGIGLTRYAIGEAGGDWTGSVEHDLGELGRQVEDEQTLRGLPAAERRDPTGFPVFLATPDVSRILALTSTPSMALVLKAYGIQAESRDPWCAAEEVRKKLVEAGMPPDHIVVDARSWGPFDRPKRLQIRRYEKSVLVEVNPAAREQRVVDAEALCASGSARAVNWTNPIMVRAERESALRTSATHLEYLTKAVDAGRFEEAKAIVRQLEPVRDELPALAAIEARLSAAMASVTKEIEAKREVEDVLVMFLGSLDQATAFVPQQKAVEEIRRYGSSEAKGLWAQWQRFWSEWKTEACGPYRLAVKQFGEQRVKAVVLEHCTADFDVDCGDGVPGWQHPDEVFECKPEHCVAALKRLPCWK